MDSVADLVLLRFAGGRRAVFLVCLVLTGLYAGVVVENERFEGTITEVYVEGRMTTEWPSHDMRFEVLDHRTTRYQEVTLYERTWTGERDEWWGDRTDTCLRLDGQLQLCDSWVGAYHTGLVDVPAAFYGNDLSGKDVLVVGGGDWIAVDHLRRYNASVTLVDLDREFLEYTKDHPYFEQYHDDAYRYDRLRVVVADALTYLRETNRTFDMVVFDGPGIEEDKLLGLYSVEFFRLARRHLAEGGVFVTWAYSPYAHGRHNKVYLNTVRAAGFTRMYSYRSYVDADADDESETVEYFYAFTAGSTPEGRFNASPVASVRARAAQYARNEWRPVPRFDGVDPNSIFDPNYAIIVK